MNDSNKLGHDPRHVNEDSYAAHRRIRLQSILFSVLLILGLIALVAFCSCKSATGIYHGASTDAPNYYHGAAIFMGVPSDTSGWITIRSDEGIKYRSPEKINYIFRSHDFVYSKYYRLGFDGGISIRSLFDTFPAPVFWFNSTSQFIICDGSPIEEYHQDMDIAAYSDRLVLTTKSECTPPTAIAVHRWDYLDEFTIIGYGPDSRVEWQLRHGEDAIQVEFSDHGKSCVFRAYQFWRDSTLER